MEAAVASIGPGRAPSLVASALALVATAVVDRATGSELGFFVFYFIPIALAAWGAGLAPGVGAALLATLAWAAIDAPRHRGDPSAFPLYWNAGIRLASFLVIAVSVARLRFALDRERGLNAELSAALAQVKQLTGLLPICGTCKKIRNDAGYWEQLESYIEQHSSAVFTHGICPECLGHLQRQLDLEDLAPGPRRRAAPEG